MNMSALMLTIGVDIMSCWQENILPKNIPIKLVVACALVDVDGRIFVQQRPAEKEMGGLWEFPGGKCEKDEIPEIALLRELKEELDIDTTLSCLAPIGFASHSYDTFHILMPFYICRVWKGLICCKEGQIGKWVEKDDLQKMPMPKADYPLLGLLREWI